MDPDEADGENLGIVKFGPRGRRRAGRRSWTAWSRPAACATGRRGRSASSRRCGRCTPSARAAIPGSRSTFPRTTSARCARSCRRSTAPTRSRPTSTCGDAAGASRPSPRRPARVAARAALRSGCCPNSARAGTDAQQNVASSHDQLPRVVALGGGTGLPNVLRGLRPLLCGPADAAADRAARSAGRHRRDLGRRRQLRDSCARSST